MEKNCLFLSQSEKKRHSISNETENLVRNVTERSEIVCVSETREGERAGSGIENFQTLGEISLGDLESAE